MSNLFKRTGSYSQQKKEMSKGAKTTAAFFAVAVLLVGGAFGVRFFINRSKTLPVTPVSYVADTWLESEASSYGYISEAGTQNVYLNSSLLVDEVYVKAGDQVKKGDPLFKYDMTQLSLKVDSYRIAYEIAKNNVTKENRLLAYYQTFAPYSAPQPIVKETHSELKAFTEPDDYNVIKTGSVDEEGTEITETFAVYDCSRETAVTSEFLESLLPGEEKDVVNAQINVYETVDGYDSVLIAKWFIKGAELDSEYIHAITDEQLDRILSKYILIAGDYSVTVIEINPPIGEMVIANYSALAPLPEVDYEKSLSQEEIDRLIKDQKDVIKSAELEAAQAELDYRKAKKEQRDGTMNADQSGIVAFVGDKNDISPDQAFITVVSGTGYQVQSSISELQLGKVSVGDTFSIYIWSNGCTYTGTIVEISEFPTSDNYSYSGSSIDSNYMFTADLDCEDELQPWDGGEIKFDSATGGAAAKFAISKAYIREDEGGNYALVADESGKIEKRYVEVGRPLWGGGWIEIISGLELEDYIAFPYGTNAVVGATADYDSEEVYY